MRRYVMKIIDLIQIAKYRRLTRLVNGLHVCMLINEIETVDELKNIDIKKLPNLGKVAERQLNELLSELMV
jgi:uncharacterized membrane protein YoaT (DUF817 family)